MSLLAPNKTKTATATLPRGFKTSTNCRMTWGNLTCRHRTSQPQTHQTHFGHCVWFLLGKIDVFAYSCQQDCGTLSFSTIFRIGAVTQQTLTELPDLCHSNKYLYVLLSDDYNLFRALSDLTSRILPRVSLKSSMPAAVACLGNRTA